MSNDTNDTNATNDEGLVAGGFNAGAAAPTPPDAIPAPVAGIGQPPPPPSPPQDWLFDAPAGGAAAGDGSVPTAKPTSKRAVIGAGIGAAVIALGAIVGINLADSGAASSTAAAANSVGGPGAQGTGQTGMPPGGAGMTGGPGGGTGGTIESIDGSSLTLSSQTGDSVTVSTSDDTTVSIAEEGSADDIDEGDSVIVMGTEDGDAIAAQRVVDHGDATEDADGSATAAGGPPGGMGGFASGEVSSVEDDSFVVTTADGDLTVTMTDDTTVIVQTTASVDDLESGDTIMVQGETADDGSITATRITAGDVAQGPMMGSGGPMDGGQMGTPPSGAPTDGSTGQTGVPPSGAPTDTATGGDTTTS